MKTKSREQLIDDMIAKQEIHELLCRFSRGCDRCDEEQLRDIYFPDAIDNHGSFVGPAKEFAAWATKFHMEELVSTSHFITNILITVDGDVARGETYVLACLRSKKGETLYDLTGAGRYIDRFEKREGVWKIAERITIFDWDRVEEVKSVNDTPLTMNLIKGLRNREDLSYKAVG